MTWAGVGDGSISHCPISFSARSVNGSLRWKFPAYVDLHLSDAHDWCFWLAYSSRPSWVICVIHPSIRPADPWPWPMTRAQLCKTLSCRDSGFWPLLVYPNTDKTLVSVSIVVLGWSWSWGLPSCCWSWNHVLSQLFIIYHAFCRILVITGSMYQIADDHWNREFTYCYSVFVGMEWSRS